MYIVYSVALTIIFKILKLNLGSVLKRNPHLEAVCFLFLFVFVFTSSSKRSVFRDLFFKTRILSVIRWKEESVGGSLLRCYGIQHSLLVLKMQNYWCDGHLINVCVCLRVCSGYVCVFVREREREWCNRESLFLLSVVLQWMTNQHKVQNGMRGEKMMSAAETKMPKWWRDETERMAE